jgi:hypothetical protein
MRTGEMCASPEEGEMEKTDPSAVPTYTSAVRACSVALSS